MIDEYEKELLLGVGTVLKERYEIIEQIAFGGFGATYKVIDLKERGMRAVKEFFPRDIATRMPNGAIVPLSAEKQEAFDHGQMRFIEEAEMLYKLNGLNQNGVNRIVKLTDYFGSNGTKYYVMDYIDGYSLSEAYKKYDHGMPYQQVMAYVSEICDGMDELHSKYNIFHRDISPENIMINRENHVQLIDFGNARVLSAQKGYTVILKVAYAPPEQYSTNGTQGTFTDIYSLAATAYYVIAGQKVPDAYERANGVDIIPLNVIKPEVPGRISDAINHALEYEPYKRPQTMKQFKQELGADAYHVATGAAVSAGAAGQAAMRITPYISITKGALSGQMVNIPADREITIGRSKKADICVGSNGYIGRIHCSLKYDSGRSSFILKDLSRNGTYINGSNIPGNTEVLAKSGSNIILGNHVCEFRIGER